MDHKLKKLLAVPALSLLTLPMFVGQANQAHADDIDWMNMQQYSTDTPPDNPVLYTDVTIDDSLDWGDAGSDMTWAANIADWYVVWPTGCKTARVTVQRYYYNLWLKVVTTQFTMSQYFCYSN